MKKQDSTTQLNANQNNENPLKNIPAELTSRNQWVVWRKETRDGKLTKVPYNPNHPNKKARINDSSTWGTYQKSCQAAQTGKVAGIGFVFTKDDPYTGVDLDKCRDKQTGQFEPWAQEIINALDSYTEVSQSGTGVHILLKGTLPPGSRRKGGIEMYESERYFCTTGLHLQGTPRTIETRDTQLKDLHAQIFTKLPVTKQPVAASSAMVAHPLTDEDVIKKAQKAKNGKAFQKVWTGDWKDVYPSQSEADLALCGKLAFWTGPNVEQLDRLFRQSGLFRPKWDERHYSDGATYGQRLMETVVAEKTDFYQSKESAGGASKKVIPVDIAETFLTQNELRSQDALHLRWYREEWLKFNGKIFQPLPVHDLRAHVMAFLQGSSGRKYAGSTLVKNVLANLEGMCLLPSDMTLPISCEEGRWTATPDLVVFQNGLLNIEQLLRDENGTEVMPHTPNIISRVALPFAFDPTARFPRWRNFLDQVLPDPESRNLLREIFGYCLTYDTSLQKFFLFEGHGANGKGVVLRILTSMLGESNVSSIPLELFGAPHGLELTLGKLVNITSDIGELDRVAEGLLKQFTGEDLMHFNPKYRAPFTAKPTAKLVMATNIRPPFRDRSEGLWRRLILLPFPITIPPKQRNPGLTEELMQELPGILNWAIGGARALRGNGCFSEPAASKVAKEEYQREANPAKTFLEEHVVWDPVSTERTDLVYQRYAAFCHQHGNRKLNESNFGKEVKACFPQVARERSTISEGGSRAYYYRGLKWAEDHVSVEPF